MLLAFAFIPARYGESAAMLPGGEAACFWSPLTYAFLHADSSHLIVNLIWMAIFGTPLARRFGALRFLVLERYRGGGRRRLPLRSCIPATERS